VKVRISHKFSDLFYFYEAAKRLSGGSGAQYRWASKAATTSGFGFYIE